MNRCPACGKTYGDEARFCTRDGTKLIVVPDKGAARETVAVLSGGNIEWSGLVPLLADG